MKKSCVWTMLLAMLLAGLFACAEPAADEGRILVDLSEKTLKVEYSLYASGDDLQTVELDVGIFRELFGEQACVQGSINGKNGFMPVDRDGRIQVDALSKRIRYLSVFEGDGEEAARWTVEFADPADAAAPARIRFVAPIRILEGEKRIDARRVTVEFDEDFQTDGAQLQFAFYDAEDRQIKVEEPVDAAGPLGQYTRLDEKEPFPEGWKRVEVTLLRGNDEVFHTSAALPEVADNPTPSAEATLPADNPAPDTEATLPADNPTPSAEATPLTEESPSPEPTAAPTAEPRRTVVLRYNPTWTVTCSGQEQALTAEWFAEEDEQEQSAIEWKWRAEDGHWQDGLPSMKDAGKQRVEITGTLDGCELAFAADGGAPESASGSEAPSAFIEMRMEPAPLSVRVSMKPEQEGGYTYNGGAQTLRYSLEYTAAAQSDALQSEAQALLDGLTRPKIERQETDAGSYPLDKEQEEIRRSILERLENGNFTVEVLFEEALAAEIRSLRVEILPRENAELEKTWPETFSEKDVQDCVDWKRLQGEFWWTNGCITVSGKLDAPGSLDLSKKENYAIRLDGKQKESNFDFSFEQMPVLTLRRGDLSRAQAECPKEYVYTGEKIEPQFTVTMDGAALKEGEDYVVPRGAMAIVSAGDHVVTLMGVGGYDGALSCTVTVRPKAVTVPVPADDGELKALGLAPESIAVEDGAYRCRDGNYIATFELRGEPSLRVESWTYDGTDAEAHIAENVWKYKTADGTGHTAGGEWIAPTLAYASADGKPCAAPPKDAGRYVATAAWSINGQSYSAEAKFEIRPGQVTVRIPDQTQSYGDALGPWTAEAVCVSADGEQICEAVPGAKSDDGAWDYEATLDAKSGGGTLVFRAAADAEPDSGAGKYALMPSGDVRQGNFEVQYESGTLTIEALDISEKWTLISDDRGGYRVVDGGAEVSADEYTLKVEETADGTRVSAIPKDAERYAGRAEAFFPADECAVARWSAELSRLRGGRATLRGEIETADAATAEELELRVDGAPIPAEFEADGENRFAFKAVLTDIPAEKQSCEVQPACRGAAAQAETLALRRTGDVRWLAAGVACALAAAVSLALCLRTGRRIRRERLRMLDAQSRESARTIGDER